MKNPAAAVFASVLAPLSFTPVHAAGLEGTQVTATAYCCSAPIEQDRFTVPATAEVGDGIEFPAGSIVTTSIRNIITSNIDVSAFSIELLYTQTANAALGTFNGFAFDFSGLGLMGIAGVSLNPASTFAPGSVGLSFDHNSVFYSGAGLAFTPDSRVLIDVELAPVPEPSPYAMAGAGLAVLAGLLRRRRSAAD